MLDRLSEKDRKGLLLFGVVLLVLIAFGVAKVVLDRQPRPGPDNCIGEPSRSTVVVLDHSEGISEQTREEIVARAMRHIRDNVQVNERVSVFTVSQLSKKALRPVVSLCRPPEDGNRVYENIQLIRKRFQQNFEQPVRSALSTPVRGSSESPIAQAITDLSLSQFLRAQANSLLVFSDMLEHTPRFSLYGCRQAESVVSRYRDAVKGAKERPTFRNTAVSLNLIPRLDQSRETLRCRDVLWTWFFGDNEGPEARLTLDYLPGGEAK